MSWKMDRIDVQVPDIGAQKLYLTICERNLAESGDETVLQEIERLATRSAYDSIRMAAQKALIEHRERRERERQDGTTTRAD